MRNNFLACIWQTLRGIPRWLRPGLGIKRWFILVMFGITVLGLGFGVILIDLYHNEVTGLSPFIRSDHEASHPGRQIQCTAC